MKTFVDVKGYLTNMGFAFTQEVPEDELVVVDDETKGIRNLVIDCESPLLILEQLIFEFQNGDNASTYKRLLQINRSLLHGAFVLDESGKKVLFRHTLQLENLDSNELEGSINALRLAMAENADELIRFSKS